MHENALALKSTKKTSLFVVRDMEKSPDVRCTLPQDNEKKKEQKRKWWKTFYQENKERILAEKREYRESNRQVIRDTQKVYRDSEKGRSKNAEEARERRALKKNCTIPLMESERERLMLLEKTRRELSVETGREYHIDHIIPLAHGGIHHPMNLRILDGTENISKQDKILPEAIALAPEHFRLYSERVSPERAWEFVRQLAARLGLSGEDLDAMIAGKPMKTTKKTSLLVVRDMEKSDE
jgi:hypothetical protein